MDFTFGLKSNTSTPSIHEMRMQQMFSSPNYKQKDHSFNLKDIFAIDIELPKVKEKDISKKEVKSKEKFKQEESFLKQISSFIENIDINDFNLFAMSQETAGEYYLYRKKKSEKIKSLNAEFSFYGIDGSIDYSKVFSGIFSENVYIKDRAIKIFEDTIGDFVRSQYCLDYISMIISTILAFYLFMSLLYSNPDCLKHYLFLF